MKINAKLIILLAFCISAIACQQNADYPTNISLERWTVTGDKGSKEKEAIQYLETTQYDKSGEEKARLFYDQNKNLAAKEIRIFEEGTFVPKGSQYKDAKDSLLSYYVFETDSEDQIIKSKAFDANSDELLRIEKFKYNSSGHLIEKTILSSEGLPVRIMKYIVDEKGNEEQVQVLQGDGTEVLTEVFDITKFNKQGLWIEKWGYVNDKPFSFVNRRISY